jgi:hypothetical protein
VHLNLTVKSAGRPLMLALLALAFLPYDTLIGLGAILRSGVRMLFTRHGLLLWQLPAYARRNARQSLADFFREMWIAPVLAVAGTALAAGQRRRGSAPHPDAVAGGARRRLVDQPAAGAPRAGPDRRATGFPAGVGPANLALLR